ncbi:MAG: ABC transporter permease [Ardenticatenaceae bacterium]|nr:ABC transporter permease [Ardenticatenaceae bacterium]
MMRSISFEQALLRPLAEGAGVAVATLTLGAIVMVAIGADPAAAYRALFTYAFGDSAAITAVLTRAAPLILSGLAVAVAFNAGIYNLGGEGQIYLGAFGAAWVGFSLTGVPALLHIALVLPAAAVAGAVGAFIPGWLRTRLGVDEVISTIMLNFVYILFTGYLATYPFRDPARWSGTTRPIAETARLPVLWADSGLNAGILVAVLLVGLAFWAMRRSALGYRWKIIGLNARFARYGGVEVEREQLTAMVISGALAGLAGALLVTGSQFRFWAQIGGGIGFDGLLISLLARNHPIGILLAALLFAAVKTGSLGMEQATTVPSELTLVLLAVLILLVTGREFVTMILARIRVPAAVQR